jgi:hypothetical protein
MIKFFSEIKSLTSLQKGTILLSLVVLTISFFLPAFYINDSKDPSAWADSWLLFFLGWMGFFGGNFLTTFFWLANPIYLIAIVLTIKGNANAVYFSFLATSIAFGFSQISAIMTSESGKYSSISSFELGYRFWVISFMILTIGFGVNNYLQIKNRNK